jgi:hypothetical protein
MTQTKHTPTPWYWDAQVWNYDAQLDAPWLVSETKGRPVVLRVDGQGKIHITEANAKFIARACNVHDELLAVLKEVVAIADRKTDLFDKARAAIAKAEAA